MSGRAFEVNFDGLVGPTHNYAGLSYGNVASMTHKRQASNPRQAALQGLAKMKFLADLGVKQAVLPPHERPHVPTLRRLGFQGKDADVLRYVANDRVLLASVSSASAMWAANAATVSPSANTHDGRVHFTPANLVSNFHRSIETKATQRILRTIFADEHHFAHHDPLPSTQMFADEGAANHTRLGATLGLPGMELFAFGSLESAGASRFPARQSYHASRAISRLHQIKLGRSVFIRQNPAAIDAGAFHNDVVAVGHRNVLLYHEHAWVDSASCIDAIARLVTDLKAFQVTSAQVPLADAISSYMFNSQIVTLADESMALIAPVESRENPRTQSLLSGLPLNVHYVDVRQSMQNGGGPACLRLRVELTEAELAAIHPGVLLSNELHARLTTWIERHYREKLTADDLADPKLLEEGRRALDELTQLLGLGSFYEFQR